MLLVSILAAVALAVSGSPSEVPGLSIKLSDFIWPIAVFAVISQIAAKAFHNKHEAVRRRQMEIRTETVFRRMAPLLPKLSNLISDGVSHDDRDQYLQDVSTAVLDILQPEGVPLLRVSTYLHQSSNLQTDADTPVGEENDPERTNAESATTILERTTSWAGRVDAPRPFFESLNEKPRESAPVEAVDIVADGKRSPNLDGDKNDEETEHIEKGEADAGRVNGAPQSIGGHVQTYSDPMKAIVEHMRPVLCHDVLRGKDSTSRKLHKRTDEYPPEYRSFYSVPMVSSSGTCLGMLTCDHPEAYYFDDNRRYVIDLMRSYCAAGLDMMAQVPIIKEQALNENGERQGNSGTNEPQNPL